MPRMLSMSRIRFGACASALVLCSSSYVWAGPDAGEGPAAEKPAERVVEMKRAADVYKEPAESSRHHRGVVARRARFRVLEETRGKGCKGPWLRIGEDAWVCSSATRATDAPPSQESVVSLEGEALLPETYIVTRDAKVYESLEQAAAATEEKTIRGLGGFVQGRSVRKNGKRFVKTPHGWVPESDVISAAPSAFKGVYLTAGMRGKRLAFVRVGRARLYDRDGRRLRERGPERQTYLGELGEPVVARGRTLYRVESQGEGERYLESDDISVIDWAERPDGVGEDERWVDVVLSQQLLVAYRGDAPVMATLVSTARTATTPGEYRIQKKRASGRLRAKPEYNTQWDVSVPWVMTLDGRLAMHTVYWHENFGRPFSQGCVNLAPTDAKWLWDWTEPALPAGWLNVTSDDDTPGTFVRIRK